MTGKQNSKGFILVFLGMLSAFGPFVMDMYLPTLPAMSDFFQTTSSKVQLGLTTSMVGLAIGQLVFGPLSDKYGRRSPLLVAMGLFLISTVGCIFSRDISQFVLWRFVQGVAGAGGVVISRSIAADKYSAHELAGMLATIGAVNGIATVVAPIGGGALADFGGWHGIFWFLFALGVLLVIGSVRFKESLPIGQRQNIRCVDMYHRFGAVLRNRQYVRYILQYGFTMGVLFTNIASAPFIMQQHYGLSPMLFSVCFGVNAVAMVISSALSVRCSTMEHALHIGNHGMLFISVLLSVAFFLNCNFWVYEALVFCLLSMVGMAFASQEIISIFSKIKYPYNVNQLTQKQAMEMLYRYYEIERWVKTLKEERENLENEFVKLPCTVKIFPSDANFFLVRVTDAVKIYNYLVAEGIIVRNRNSVSLCGNCLRVTVGTRNENERLVEALEKYKV